MLNTKNNNIVTIQGILSAIDLKNITFMKNGEQRDAISGSITVLTEQMINGVMTSLEIPVYIFAAKLTNAGKVNPAYTSAENVMNNFVSIAAAGIDKADRIRIRQDGGISMNEYYGRNGNLISYPRIKGSFIEKMNPSQYSPCATFDVTFVIAAMGYVTDDKGVEDPHRFKIRGILPRFGNQVDVVDFYVINDNVINAISTYWQANDTVKAQGVLNFTTKTESVSQTVDFGEAISSVRTVSVSELIINGGNSTPLDEPYAYNADEIKEALSARTVRLEELKRKSEARGTAGKAPEKKNNAFADLGF